MKQKAEGEMRYKRNKKTRVKNGQSELEAKFEHFRITLNSSDESNSEASDAQCPVGGITYRSLVNVDLP